MEHARIFRYRHSPFTAIYLLNFLVSFHLFLLIYINSSFLSSFVGERFVGFIYMVSALIGIFALWQGPKLLKKIGDYRALVILAFTEFLAVLGLATFTDVSFIIPIFLLHGTLYVLILFSLDVLLESHSQSEEHTGRVRGAFLTMQNIALILAPMVAGLVVGNDEFWKVYILSSTVLVPFLYVLMQRFKTFTDPIYDPHHHLKVTIGELRRNQTLFKIFMAQFLMRFFFSWMVIYTPIYLHQHIGLAWNEIGVMFTLMLLPYILVEWPAGKLADTRLGEKELMSAGFVITALGVGSMSWLAAPSVILWTLTLFVARIGAALLEITTESYFFKHVRGGDTDHISFFRIARPLAYVVGPLVASITLFLVDFRFIFVVLALILLSGLYFSLTLRDTR